MNQGTADSLGGLKVRETGDDLVEEAVYDPIQPFFRQRCRQAKKLRTGNKVSRTSVSDFPESRYVADARFNIGLALEL